jgi:hypothetical protein
VCLDRLRPWLEVRQGDFRIEANGSRICSDFSALVETNRGRGQVTALERLEMALRNLRLEGDSLERQTAIFARAPEQIANGGPAVYSCVCVRGP